MYMVFENTGTVIQFKGDNGIGGSQPIENGCPLYTFYMLYKHFDELYGIEGFEVI